MDNSSQIVMSEKVQMIPAKNPYEMISQAMAGGVNLDSLTQVMALQERWEANEARKAFNRALASFKQNPPVIGKDRKVEYGNTKYNHASLANVVRTITAELSKHDLSATWGTSQTDKICVTCRIIHSQGHSEEVTLCAPADTSGSKNSIQAIGSTVSYLQRYTLLSALGLATEEQDDDGKSAESKKIDDKQLSTLRDLLISAGDEKSEGKVAAHFGVSSLEDLPESQYRSAESLIEARKKAKEAKAAK